MLTRSLPSYKSNRRSVVNVFFGLSLAHWLRLLVLCAVTGLILSTFFFDGDIWVAAACGLSVAIFVHLCSGADRYVAFPGLICFVASIELLLAPVVASALPPTFHEFQMAVPLDMYLQYAIPAIAVLWIGLHWPLNRVLLATRVEWTEPSPLAPRQRLQLDIVLVLGLLLSSFARYFPPQLFFLVTILGSFSFFSALVWMLTRTPGWKSRVVIVMLQLIATASADGIFYVVLQWSGFFLLVYAFRSRWRSRLALALILATAGAVILQYVKSDYRHYIGTHDASFVERVSALGSMAWSKVMANDDPNGMIFGDVLVRFDEGWIVSRIMKVVPHQVPYAEGETIEEALTYALKPRVFFPNKAQGASRILFARFTGLQLNSSTSMGLSIIGEMYANFGYWGGVSGTFVFGSLVGLAYARFAKLARKSPHWWAAAPIVLLAAIEPAWNLEDISNYIVKSALILFLLTSAVPAFRELLALKPIWRRKESPSFIAMSRERARFGLRRTQ
jgi:hypothetical protein